MLLLPKAMMVLVMTWHKNRLKMDGKTLEGMMMIDLSSHFNAQGRGGG